MSDDPETDEDTVFELLSSARRRYLLYRLRRQGGTAEINDLVEDIAAWENEVPPEELSTQAEKRVYVSLYQTHVPKLEKHGIVEYEEDGGRVVLTDRAYELDRYLRPREPRQSTIPWRTLYLAIAGTGAALVATVLADLWLFAGLSATRATGAVVAALGVTALGQYLVERGSYDDPPRELTSDRSSRNQTNGG